MGLRQKHKVQTFSFRISKIVAVLFILAVVFVTARFAAGPTPFPAAGLHPEPLYVRLEKQNIREYVLGERYGQLPETLARFRTEQIRREYVLGERYGVAPQQEADNKALREVWLGERYGQVPDAGSYVPQMRLFLLTG